jgi:ribose transport system permease protein
MRETIIEKTLPILAKQTIFIVLFALILIFALSSPNFLTGSNIQVVARQISFDAVVAFGQVVVLIAGGIDLSVGSVLSMAAALTMGLQPLGVGVAVAAALLMGVFVGAVNGILVTRFKIVPFIATLGTMTAVYGLMLTYTKQNPIPGKVDWFTFFGDGSIGPVPVPFAIMLVLLLLLHVLLTYTRFGRNLYAVGGNAEAAQLSGVRVERVQFWAFVISGFCAALGGVLLASRLNSSTIHIGLQTPLLVLAACIMGGASILGGRGSALGAFWGVLALGILSNGMNLLSVFTYYQLGIRAIILIIVVAVDAFYISTLNKRLAPASAVGKLPTPGRLRASK